MTDETKPKEPFFKPEDFDFVQGSPVYVSMTNDRRYAAIRANKKIVPLIAELEELRNRAWVCPTCHDEKFIDLRTQIKRLEGKLSRAMEALVEVEGVIGCTRGSYYSCGADCVEIAKTALIELQGGGK